MSKPTFSIEEIAKYPSPGYVAPGAFAFSPDDCYLTYLYSPEHSLSRQLFALEIKTRQSQPFLQGNSSTTEENISRAEALRRERQRQLSTGVTQYEWERIGQRVLIPFPDGLYVQNGLNGSPIKILDTSTSPALDPRFSPDGKWVSYVQDAELYILPSEGGEPRQLTYGALGSGITNGLAEYVAQEEMGRFTGYWWSPDSSRLAFEEVDETNIPLYPIFHQGMDSTGEEAREDHRYPFAGQANARVRLGVVALAGGEPLWLDLGDFEYLARVKWLPDGRLTAQVQNREQSRLDLLCFDLHDSTTRILLSETSTVWINLHDMFHPLRQGGFIWASERTGYMHLYLYDQDARLVRPLTSGDWLVEKIAGVNEKQGLVFFSGRLDSPLESHLYSVSLLGGTPHRLTREPGMHNIILDHACKRFVDVHDSPVQPPHVTLRRLSDGARIHEVYANDDRRVSDFKLRPPELVNFQNRDGVTLYGALYRPAGTARKPLPTIVYVYGGPHVQNVAKSWNNTASMRVQYLRGLGYQVFVLDNRGSARRGLAFEGAIRHDMGHLEVQDQVDGVNWLVNLGLADPQRVGIYGWSYGGYMSAMCLCRAPQTFKLAVAGAPVTTWEGYDTHYTERYMGTPQSNPEGYASGSILNHVENLSGRLLLVHGLIDENVHFRHTARLINALIHARKHYDLLLFPDERHSPRRLADRVYMEEQIRDYFIKYL